MSIDVRYISHQVEIKNIRSNYLSHIPTKMVKIRNKIFIFRLSFNKNGTVQAERDRLKGHILELYKIPFIRFNTNGSGEKEMITEKLDGLVG